MVSPSRPKFTTDKLSALSDITGMSFTEVLQELPALTFEQRQLLVRRALELDDPPLNDADMSLVDSRLAALREDPTTAVSLEEMKSRLRSRYNK
jgi:uncharacterized protein Smg (DUF494 family)